MSDGKLIFKTQIDNVNVEKDLKALERKIRSSQESISKMNSAKLPLEKQLETLSGKLETAKKDAEMFHDEMESINKAMAGGSSAEDYMVAASQKPAMEKALKESENELGALQKQWNVVNDKVKGYDEKIKTAEESIARNTERAGELRRQLVTPDESKMTESMAKAEKTVGSFGKRLRNIAASALMFNLISKGLRSMVSYMGQAAMADKDFATALASLRGSILSAFQPIYEWAIPAITTLINWLNTAVQVIGRFFAALTGKSYSQMQKNAKALNNEAAGISSVGDAAEEAEKQLLGFDEINKLESLNRGGGVSGGGGGNSPIFDEIDFPSAWEATIEDLALKIKDILFKWDDLTAEDIVQKLVFGLSTLAGGLIGFAIGGVPGAVIGATVGAGIGLLITSVLFDDDGELSKEELLSSLETVLMAAGAGVIGFALGGPAGAAIGATVGTILGLMLSKVTFDGDGELSTEEIIKSLVAGLSILGGGVMGFIAGGPLGAAVGATIGLGLTFSISAMDFDGVKRIVKEILQEIEDYFSETFSSGFIKGLTSMVWDGINILWEMFVNFVNDIVNAWNTLWGYQTTGTVGDLSGGISNYSMMPETPISSIPALAQGAVLPANKPFLAMVGDQKSGTNVEAPLETIKQALAEVLAENGFDVDVNFTGSLSQLARVLTPEITKCQRRTERAKGG